MKLGEIFHVNKNMYAFICIHCSREYEQFADFAVHSQEHLMSIARQYSTIQYDCDEYVSGDHNKHVKINFENDNTQFDNNDDDDDAADNDDNNDYFFNSLNNTMMSQPNGNRRDNNGFASDVKINYAVTVFLNDTNGTSTTINSNYPKDMKWFMIMNPDEYRQLFEGIDYLVRDKK